MIIGNYTKVVIRGLRRHKTIAAINIAGLAIGMAAALLAILWVRHELSFDRYHEHSNRVFRVIIKTEAEGVVRRSAKTPAPMAAALMEEFPWVEDVARFFFSERLVNVNGARSYHSVCFADPSIFNLFTIPIIRGNRSVPFQTQHEIIISDTMARRYFPDSDPIGKTITLDDKNDFRIGGVFRDIPDNSHFQFHYLTSIDHIPANHQVNWGMRNYYTYLLARKDARVNGPTAVPASFVDKYIGSQIRRQFNFAFQLQPIHDIHLHSDIRNEIQPNGSLYNVSLFLLAGLFILLIACLNYINLTTAWYAGRQMEVGLRKVLGASSRHLLRQFLMESIMLVMMAAPISLALADWFLPIFNSLTGKQLSIWQANSVWLALAMIALIIITGLISGIIPAYFMLRASPIHALKCLRAPKTDDPSLRTVLVVFQFTLSIAFMIIALIISQQVDYLKSNDPGMTTQNIINIPLRNDPTAIQKQSLLKQEFLANPGVVSATISAFTPGKARYNMNYSHERVPENQSPQINCIPVDHDFIKTFGLQITAGRDFSAHFPSDAKQAYIINQAAQKEFGFKNPIGKHLAIANRRIGPIIGVVKDFHYNSLHQSIQPLVLYIDPDLNETISLRIVSDHIPQTIARIRQQWQKHIPRQPFAYTMLQDQINSLYKTESNLQKILAIVTILSIFIASLGLFGLAAYISLQRTREIAIRKVLGAPIHSLFSLLTRHFARWILLANILAWPVAYIFIANWLLQFSFRIPIPLASFILSALAALAIALITITYHTLHTVRQNPAKILRQH